MELSLEEALSQLLDWGGSPVAVSVFGERGKPMVQFRGTLKGLGDMYDSVGKTRRLDEDVTVTLKIEPLDGQHFPDREAGERFVWAIDQALWSLYSASFESADLDPETDGGRLRVVQGGVTTVITCDPHDPPSIQDLIAEAEEDPEEA